MPSLAHSEFTRLGERIVNRRHAGGNDSGYVNHFSALPCQYRLKSLGARRRDPLEILRARLRCLVKRRCPNRGTKLVTKSRHKIQLPTAAPVTSFIKPDSGACVPTVCAASRLDWIILVKVWIVGNGVAKPLIHQRVVHVRAECGF